MNSEKRKYTHEGKNCGKHSIGFGNSGYSDLNDRPYKLKKYKKKLSVNLVTWELD